MGEFKSKSFKYQEEVTTWVNKNKEYIEVVSICCYGNMAEHIYTVFYWEHD
jgi:hypothetical protein